MILFNGTRTHSHTMWKRFSSVRTSPRLTELQSQLPTASIIPRLNTSCLFLLLSRFSRQPSSPLLSPPFPDNFQQQSEVVAREYGQRFALGVAAPARLLVGDAREGLPADHLNGAHAEVGQAAEKAVQPALERAKQHLVQDAVVRVAGLRTNFRRFSRVKKVCGCLQGSGYTAMSGA